MRLLARLLVALLGVLVGVLAAVEHRQRDVVLGVDVPWGLVLGLGCSWLVAVAAGRVVRTGTAWFTMGWCLVPVLQQVSGDGSYLVADDGLGWAFLGLGVGGLVLAVVRDSRGER